MEDYQKAWYEDKKVAEFATPTDLTICALNGARKRFVECFGNEPRRLVYGNNYGSGDVLMIIMKSFGTLIPIERCYSISEDAWFLADDEGHIFYSPGA